MGHHVIMALYSTQETSTRTNFIAWTRYRAAGRGVRAEGRSIHLQTYVDANGPKRRSINMEGALAEISVSDLTDEIRSIIQITYPSDKFELAEALSKHLGYALSNSHRMTIVIQLNDSEGTYRGELVLSFGPG